MSFRPSHAALLRGGFTRRIALDYSRTNDVLRGPLGLHPESNHMFIVHDSDGIQYADDEVTYKEYDVLPGLYYTWTGQPYSSCPFSSLGADYVPPFL
jgi:hypothetical protein